MTELTIKDTWLVHHPINSGQVQVVSALAANARIRELEAQLEKSHLQEISTVGQLQTALEQRDKARNRERLIADNLRFERELHDATRREAAEAQAREQTCRAAVREACENYEEVVFDDGLCACLPLEYISALNEEADLPDADPAALQSAIEQAVAKERETIIAKLLEIGALGDGDYIAMIRARSLA